MPEAPEARECPQCHKSIAPGASFCGACGARSVFDDNDATMMITTPGHNWSRATQAYRPTGTVQSFEVGSVIAERYEILKMLGEGGMGAVYKAQDRELERTVALKVIRSDLAGHASVLQRFKQELILARKITHRNVIRIYDLGVSEGLRFITMEYVEGRDLSSMLEERKFEPGEAVKILRQACDALKAAHSEGVVHRD